MDASGQEIFRVENGEIQGNAASAAVKSFGSRLIELQDCAALLGGAVGMEALSYAHFSGVEESLAFCFDPTSEPDNPALVGSMTDQKTEVLPMLMTLLDELNKEPST